MPIVIKQLHTIEAAQVGEMIAAHYKKLGVPAFANFISFQVHEGSSGGFSSSGPSLGTTTIRFPDGKRPVGMPDTMTLRPEQVQEIAALFLSEALGLSIHPSHITINVSGHSGGGFSSRQASLDSLTFRTTHTVG